MTDSVPEHIVVGIENTDRARDMDPERAANSFVQFLGTELVPFIDANYRTSAFRILCGQSLSSIFTMHVFLKQPDLFNGYVMSSFGLYKESLATRFDSELRAFRKPEKGQAKYIFVTNGKLDAYDRDGSVTRRGEQFLI